MKLDQKRITIRFTLALSLLCTLAAHAAHVIPCTRNSTRISPGDSPGPDGCPLLTAADDTSHHIPAIPRVRNIGTGVSPRLTDGLRSCCC